jgi:transcriptional regulator with XRE-family HTH domain
MRRSSSASRLQRLIGQRVLALREKEIPRLSRAALGERTGLSRAAIAAIESGIQGVSISSLYQLARALDCEVSLLLPTLAELYEPDGVTRDSRPVRPAKLVVEEFLQKKQP